MINERQIRAIIRKELKEVYNKDLSGDDIQSMSNAIWGVFDVDAMVNDIARRCVNAYNGSKREPEARTRMVNVINKGLETQAEAIADAIMEAVS